MTKRNTDPVLGEKDQEIIAVGASVASGCLPCTKFHLRAASSAGACAGDILQAVRDATAVRKTATGIMARAGGMPESEADQAIPDPAGAASLVRELVKIAAAYTVNCSTGLEGHMAAARALGATDGQMFTALKIACAIRDVACQKAKAAAGSVLGVSEEQAVACGCAEADGASPGEAGGCSCQPGEKVKRRYKKLGG
jgi:AhpD family alkylhydroperoxidase